jgi:hypothetical protein
VAASCTELPLSILRDVEAGVSDTEPSRDFFDYRIDADMSKMAEDWVSLRVAREDKER